MDRRIVGFHQDEEHHWVAELECGHQQHVRHNPPWTNRPWVVTQEGRARVLGQTLPCRKCDATSIDGTTLHHRTHNPVTLRLMDKDDLPMLHAWLNRPHIVEWWGGEEKRPTLAEVKAHYLPRVMAEERVTPYIAMLGEEPIGYAQSYVALNCGGGWWEEETDPGVRGIDQSLADPALLGKGLGTKLVSALVDLLFSDPGVTKIQTDPAPNNQRAIRCYEKAGFRQIKTIVTPDGPAVYMLRARPVLASVREATQPPLLRPAD